MNVYICWKCATLVSENERMWKNTIPSEAIQILTMQYTILYRYCILYKFNKKALEKIIIPDTAEVKVTEGTKRLDVIDERGMKIKNINRNPRKKESEFATIYQIELRQLGIMSKN